MDASFNERSRAAHFAGAVLRTLFNCGIGVVLVLLTLIARPIHWLTFWLIGSGFLLTALHLSMHHYRYAVTTGVFSLLFVVVRICCERLLAPAPLRLVV